MDQHPPVYTLTDHKVIPILPGVPVFQINGKGTNPVSRYQMGGCQVDSLRYQLFIHGSYLPCNKPYWHELL